MSPEDRASKKRKSVGAAERDRQSQDFERDQGRSYDICTQSRIAWEPGITNHSVLVGAQAFFQSNGPDKDHQLWNAMKPH